MQEILIHRQYKEFVVRYIGEDIVLPDNLQNKIDEYWQEQIENGRKYFNGEVFILDEVIEHEDVFEIKVARTNFAHFLYNRKVDNNLDKYNVNTVFASSLIITKDNKIILGKMGQHTSRAGTLQFSGGGLENGDLEKNGIFNMKHSVQKEIGEELDIDLRDESIVEQIKFYCIKMGGNGNIAVIYKIRLKLDENKFMQKYNLFVGNLQNKNQKPEFEKIIAIPRNKKDIEKFIATYNGKMVDYIPKILLETLS